MAAAQNHFIGLLPHRDRLRLMAKTQAIHLNFAEVLCEPGDALRNVYFPVEGFISLLAVQASGPALEVGMVGCEGVLGAQLVLGVERASLRALVQGAGSCLRITATAMRIELAESPALQALLLRYVHVQMQQFATSAVCLSSHRLGPRLARWLLMTQDRAGQPLFHVTHEFLASMLGVRRVGVTAAAGLLQKRGLISYHRGHMEVLDRAGLEAAACACYAEDRRTHTAHLG